MRIQLLLAAGWFAALTLGAVSLSAADAHLQHLTDQLRGRTARLMFETAGLFGDASNFRTLDSHGRAMHDTAESLAKTAGATSPLHERLDKDLAALAHYRVQFGKECDLLARELRGLWGESFAGSFVQDDLRVLLFRLDSIQRLGMAIDRHVHPGRAVDGPLPGELSSRPGIRCPADAIPLPELPDVPPAADPRPIDPAPADPAPADPRPLDPLPLPPGGLGIPRIPPGSTGIDPGRRIPGLPRPDLGSRIPIPGIGDSAGAGGSGSGTGSGSGRFPGVPSDRLLPGVDSILRDALGSRPGGGLVGGGSGSGTGTGSSSGTGRIPGIPGGGLLPRAGGIRIPVPSR